MAISERLTIILETVGASPVVRDFNRVGGAAGGLGTKVSGLSGKFGQLAGASQAAFGAGGPLAAGLAAATAGVTAFSLAGRYAATTYTELVGSVVNLQRAIGGTMEDASRIIAATDDFGISAEVVTKSMFKLTRNVAENADGLREHGIVAARDAQGNVNVAETLLNVADAYNATTDPAARAQLLTDAFGKSGTALIPILERERSGIKALYQDAESAGQIFDDQDKQRLDEYRASMDDLQDSVQALALIAGEALVPMLSKAADMMSRLITAARGIDDIPFLGDLLRNVSKGAFAFAGGGDAATDSLIGLEGAAGEAAEQLAEDEKAINALTKAVLAVPAAQRAYEQSVRAVTSSERSLSDARKEYTKLLKEGAVDEEKVADVRRSLADATRSLGSAQRNLRERQEEYNEALTYFQAVGGDTAYDKLQDASDNLADANDGVASATERQQDASEDLQKALKGDPEFNDKLAAAKVRVTDAELSLADAQYTSSQRAWELDAALDEQNTLLEDNAAYIAGVRTEWEALLAKKPEIEAFINGPLAALKGAMVPGPVNWTGPTGGGGDFSPLSAPAPVGSAATTNNNTFNIAPPASMDTLTLARNIVWELN
jgi:hypothetical protein